MPDRELQARIAVLECAFIELYAELRRTGALSGRQSRSVQLAIRDKSRRVPESAYAWQLADKLAAEPPYGRRATEQPGVRPAECLRREQ